MGYLSASVDHFRSPGTFHPSPFIPPTLQVVGAPDGVSQLTISALLVPLQLALNIKNFLFPGGSDGNESACNGGVVGLIPGLGRSPREGNGNPLQ